MRKTLEGRGKLHEARAKQDQLNAARQTVEALQLAVEAGQQQVTLLASSLPGVFQSTLPMVQMLQGVLSRAFGRVLLPAYQE